jgi:membrane fusion protein
MSKKLFRQEAIDAQREKFFGEATIARPLPLWMLTALAAAAAGLMIAVAVWGQYTRRERVEGYLALDVGAARVLIPDAGRIAELMVKEGQDVAMGAPLAKISYDRSTEASGSTSDAVARELAQRRAILEKEQNQWRDLGEQQVQQLRKKVVDLQSELTQIDAEMKLQQRRLLSAREQAQKFTDLAKDKFYSDVAVRQKQDEVTDQEIRLQALKRQRITLDRELSNARMEEPTITLKARAQVDQVTRQISEVQQTLATEDAKRETVIRAPINGTVTNIAINQGQSVAADALLATVLPRGSVLHVELLVPTRAIGFVTKGKQVVMRYEAFPFERFGQYRGVIAEVSQAVWSAGEKVGPLVIKEPVYRVDVKLDKQTVAALGQEYPLRSGMLVNADILLEKRSLMEWIFEPVIQLRGRL